MSIDTAGTTGEMNSRAGIACMDPKRSIPAIELDAILMERNVVDDFCNGCIRDIMEPCGVERTPPSRADASSHSDF